MHLIGVIESFPWMEPCVNSHPLVECFALVLILEPLSPERMSYSNDPIEILRFASRYLEAKQVASVLRASSTGFLAPITASNRPPKRLTRSGTVFKFRP